MMRGMGRAGVALGVAAGCVLGICMTVAGKDKKKSTLPGYVLEAQTVLVMIDPDAGTAMNDPQGNRTAREDVEKALMRWGRLRLVMSTSLADLVILIRRGNTQPVQPTVSGEPPNDRPVIVQGAGDTIRVGVQQGRSPDAAETGGPTMPGMGGTVGPSEDMFTVYQGRVDEPPLDLPVAWRYSGKGALKAPDVRAVNEFKKAVEEAVKEQEKRKQQNQSAPAASKP